MSPQRIQMSRQHPWRADNPDAVIVARPSRWGNPFSAGRCFDPTLWAVDSRLSYDAVGPRFHSKAEATVAAVFRFAKYAQMRGRKEPEWLSALTGHDTVNRYAVAADEISNMRASLAVARKIRGLSLRAVAVEIGISFSTVTRIEAGHACDLDSAAAIFRWLANGAKP